MADAETASPPQEIELKFEIEPSGLLAIRALPCFAAPGPAAALLVSTYWDTPDGRLAEAGLTLRVRRDGARRLQAVKSAGGAGLLGRGEWEGEVETDCPDLEALAGTPLARLLTPKLARRLQPLFSSRVRRTRRVVKQDGAFIEVSLDEGELQAGEETRMLLQLELELKQGDPAALFAFARPLLDIAPLRLSFVTKAAAGYALAAPDRPPSKPKPSALDPDEDASVMLQAAVRAVLEELSGGVERVLVRPAPKTVHQVRVAARRLRAALAVAAELGPDPARDAVEQEVRWLAGELNAARDLDVFLADTLGPEPDLERAGDYAALRAALERARASAYAGADAALRSERLRRLLFDATAWASGLPRAGASAHSFAAQALDGRLKRARKRAKALSGEAAHELHRFRIAIKKLRYAAEFFAGLPADDPDARARFLKAMRRLQDGLGLLNDVAVAPTVVRPTLAGEAAPGAALLAGERIGVRAAGARRSLKEARKGWERLDAAGPFWR